MKLLSVNMFIFFVIDKSFFSGADVDDCRRQTQCICYLYFSIVTNVFDSCVVKNQLFIL